MIKKSLIVFAVLFTLYTIFIVTKPKLSSSQHQWQNNVVKAEKFIYKEDAIENLILGSSLSCHFIMDSLPNFYNLSFEGQSVFDGLKIIERTGKLPKNIYIETNVLLKKESKDFTSMLFSIIPFNLKKHFTALRTNKQPIPITIKYLTEVKDSLKSTLKPSNSSKEKHSSKESENPALENPELFVKMLDNQIKIYSKHPDLELMNEQFVLLMDYVKYLESNGVRIIFYEMPINHQLTELLWVKTIRKRLLELFPKNKYKYILRDISKYKTTDGLHLKKEEAIKYTSHFKKQIFNH